MLTNFKIDATRTFPMGVIFLAAEPKVGFGSTEQDRTKSGDFKWDVHLLVGMRNEFTGKLGFETLKVGLTSESSRNPLEHVDPQTPVQLIDFEIGVMEKTKKLPDGTEKIIGVSVWYRCGEIRSTAATAPAAA